MDEPSLSITDQIFQNIIDALPVLLFWTDKNNVYLGNNALHAMAFGFSSPRDLIGHTLYESFAKVGLHSSIADRISEEHKKIMETKEGETLEYTVSLFDSNHQKKETTYLSQKYPLFNRDKEVIGLIGISMDITELKNTQKALVEAKEKAEASNAAKTDFISHMSHDIRTPISGVIGMVQDLLNKAKNTSIQLSESKPGQISSNELVEKLYDLIEVIEEDSNILMGSADQLLHFCNEILETMRLDSGKATVDRESFDLYQIVSHNIDLLQSVAKHRKLDFSADIDSSVPKYLDGLRTYLDRTLLNLLSNALKFTEKGHVKISITVSSEKLKRPYTVGDKVVLQIAIEDTGIGIPEDKFEMIFDHFSRLTPSYEGNYKGSGLGLYTVKRYVEAMQGRIHLKSKLGTGSTFTLTIPFEVSGYNCRVQKSIRISNSLKQRLADGFSKKKETSDASSSGKKSTLVLIAEDSHVSSFAIKVALEPFGCAVDFAMTGAEAVEKANSTVYDLILMDIGLPDFNGLEATRRIRALSDQEKSQVPIVALTGHLAEEKRDECIAAGMNDLLSKPAQPLALESIFERFVWKSVEGVPIQKEKIPFEVMDWDASLRMMHGNETFLKNLLSSFVKELKITRRIFAENMETHNFRELRQELHRCLGGVVYMRLPRLEQSLINFQSAIKAEPQDLEQINICYLELEAAIDMFLRVVDEIGIQVPV